MNKSEAFRLYVLKENLFFDKGTVFELERYANEKGLLIPDRGDGTNGYIEIDTAIPCPTLSENIPPSLCPVKITSITQFCVNDIKYRKNIDLKSNNDIGIFQTNHYQQIRVRGREEYRQPNQLLFLDRLKGYEIYNLEHPATEKIDGQQVLCIEISHIPPGFYEIILTNEGDYFMVIHCIKFFPEYIQDMYSDLIYPYKSFAVEDAKQGIDKHEDDQEKKLQESRYETYLKFHGQPQFSPEILNKAIQLITEWGENYQQPIDERLLKTYPNLSHEDILALTKSGKEVESFIYQTCEEELDGKITENDIYAIVKKKYPWLDDDIIGRLKNIGMFYARK